jgi:malonyl-CoA decarboxylase
MPYEPLVILHVALTNNISSNILNLLRKLDETSTNSDDDIETATHAIFYSISSCQKGLKSIDLGNSLIKNCVNLLKHELPSLKNFHTLSPVPGFRVWLNTKLVNNLDENFKKFFIKKFGKLINVFGIDVENLGTFVQYLNSDEFKHEVFTNLQTIDERVILCVEFLNSCCAYYLINEKQRGLALNSVCNFHIKNGALVGRINFGADLTDKGWKLSYGLMVNYTYNLNDLDNNCLSYLNEKKISASESVLKFL